MVRGDWRGQKDVDWVVRCRWGCARCDVLWRYGLRWQRSPPSSPSPACVPHLSARTRTLCGALHPRQCLFSSPPGEIKCGR
jgi:hypothetical protein